MLSTAFFITSGLKSLETARLRVRLDYGVRVIANANHSIMRAAAKPWVADCITLSRPRHQKRFQAIDAAQLHKCWPPRTQSDISPQHEQKHLLHNRSNCRYRDRAQIARPVLGIGLAGAIATSEESSLLMRIATLSVSLSVPAKG
jgi:hypothetical protein